MLAFVACGGTSADPAPSADGSVAATVETMCADTVDNDNDGMVDCADDDCAMAVAAAGACVNEDDLPRFRDLDYNVEWNACIGQCQLDTDCLGRCFSERNGTSLECSACFAAIIPCVVGRCAARCPNGGGSPDCLACIGSECVPAYKECFGELVCAWEYGCRDQIDNDGDGLTDSQDPDCN